MSNLSNKQFGDIARICYGIVVNEQQSQLPGQTPRSVDPTKSFRGGFKARLGMNPNLPFAQQVVPKLKGHAGRVAGAAFDFAKDVAIKTPAKMAGAVLRNKYVRGATTLAGLAGAADYAIRGKQSVPGQIIHGPSYTENFEMSAQPLTEEVIVESLNHICEHYYTHLIESGYADTIESAAIIFENMSDDWFFTIFEKSLEEETNG